MNVKSKSMLEIHISVLLFGVAGLFGKLLSLPPIIIVLGRVIFSSVFLFIILYILKKDMRLKERSHYLYLVIMGTILAIHWSSFFKSIQMSTVAIGLVTFSTFPVFVTFLEPYFFKEEIKKHDIIIAAVAFIGVVLVTPNFEIGNTMTQGVLWGILSGFTYAILSMMNRKYVRQYQSMVLAFYEQVTCAIVLMPFLFLQRPVIEFKDLLLLSLLGVVFTGASHSLFINSLKNIKTQTAGIISCLEPLYGIIFAVLLLNEIPRLKVAMGCIVILGSVFYSTLKSK